MGEALSVRYDVRRDRLIGADHFGNFKGHPVKNLVLSMTRAMALKDALVAFDEVYKRRMGSSKPGASPYPKVLAIIGAAFEIGDDAGLPDEYSQLAQVITIVPGITNLDRGLPNTREVREHFAKQLFQLLRLAHFDAEVVLNRGEGSSLNAEYVTPRGELTDLYFLTPTSKISPENIVGRRAIDLRGAFKLLWQSTGAIPMDVTTLFESAVSTYLGTPNVPMAVGSQLMKTLDSLTLASSDAAEVPIMKLAGAIQQERTRDNAG